MTDFSNFLSIVEGSETVRQRWAAITEKAIADAREQGVAIEVDDVLNIREARLMAMGAPLDEEAYQQELLNLPALSKAQQKKAISEGDADARAAAVADLNRDSDHHHSHHMAHLSRKMTKAREMGIATPPEEADSLSKNERLQMLKDVKDPSTKISLGRKWGLIT
jgi:hypothetical protein